MAFEMSEVGSSLTDARLTSLEQELGVILPHDYREFLVRYNGGRPNPSFFPILGFKDNPFGGIQLFLAVDVPIKSSNLDWMYYNYRERMPRNILPIAITGTGDVLCLSFYGSDKGSVYFWDHDNEYSPPTYDNMYLIAPSFPEFLESIHFRDLSADIARALKGAKIITPRH